MNPPSRCLMELTDCSARAGIDDQINDRPQSRQNRSVSSAEPSLQLGHDGVLGCDALEISTVKIPVGTMIMLYPISIMIAARILPGIVIGVASPYPTVVMVTTAQ